MHFGVGELLVPLDLLVEVATEDGVSLLQGETIERNINHLSQELINVTLRVVNLMVFVLIFYIGARFFAQLIEAVLVRLHEYIWNRLLAEQAVSDIRDQVRRLLGVDVAFLKWQGLLLLPHMIHS